MALGHGEQIGYSNLRREPCLDTASTRERRFTDWGRRPLDKRQIDYAIADVTHLATVFPRMVEKLKRTGRGAWLDEEMEQLADPSSFAFPPEDAWKRLSCRAATRLFLVASRLWRHGAKPKRVPRTSPAAGSSRTTHSTKWCCIHPRHRTTSGASAVFPPAGRRTTSVRD